MSANRPYKILVVNGPNLGRLGVREPEIYGRLGLDALPGLIAEVLGAAAATPPAFELDFFQSNHEGALIDRLEEAHDQGVSGVVINAGAFTHTSLALADCLASLACAGIPCIEVHITNVAARPEKIRHKSLIAPHCLGVISGFGLAGYGLGVKALLWHLQEKHNAQ